MTDGTTASIAANKVEVVELTGTGNMTWVYESIKIFFEGKTTFSIAMPPTFPGAVNPLLYWTTTNLQGVTSAFVESIFAWYAYKKLEWRPNGP
jgi:hypothetical protein